jgi:photosystem II stability/assembly factor-like uncharacterized protein
VSSEQTATPTSAKTTNDQRFTSQEHLEESLKPRSALTATIVLILAGVSAWSSHAIHAAAAQKAPLKPVESISYRFHNHIHGIGYDSQNDRLFIATHYGLFIWKDRKLYQLGESRDDFMGFSLHPSRPDVIYTSGHPKSGGNLGVMISEDGGATFRRIFRGVQGETVDFHAMTVSPANPQILYGFFDRKLYRSKDAGKSWQIVPATGLPPEGFCFGAPCLQADGKKESRAYAGTPAGLMLSEDFGSSWTVLASDLGAVAGIGADPADARRLLAFAQRLGTALSRDGGKTWQAINNGIDLSRGEFVFAFAFSRKSPDLLFAATPEKVFRSADGGRSWERIL